MKTLVFGGTFNPPHLGHQLMVEQVLLNSLNDGTVFDQVWLLPVGKHSFLKNFIDKNHRLAMLQLMIESICEKHEELRGKIRIETYELEHSEESQTFNTLEALAQKYPENKFSFLIGSDNLSKFSLWHNYLLMLEKFKFYVYPRVSFPFSPMLQGMVALNDFPQMEVSSSKVRLALANNTSLKDLLNIKIINYIKEKKLYGKN